MYFRARYYDPQTGEFISRDPLGYVDGMSQYRAYFVPGAVDPEGTVKLTLSTFVKPKDVSDCGGSLSEIVWDFDLDNGEMKKDINGLIIQFIKIRAYKGECGMKPSTEEYKYAEAWVVKKGEISNRGSDTILLRERLGVLKDGEFSGGEGTFGNVTTFATAFFLSDEETDKTLANYKFITDKNHKDYPKPAGGLAAKETPSLGWIQYASLVPGIGLRRTLTTKWCCCKKNRMTTEVTHTGYWRDIFGEWLK